MLCLFIFTCIMILIIFCALDEWLQSNYFLKLQNYNEIMKYIRKNQYRLNDENFFKKDYNNYQCIRVSINNNDDTLNIRNLI